MFPAAAPSRVAEANLGEEVFLVPLLRRVPFETAEVCVPLVDGFPLRVRVRRVVLTFDLGVNGVGATSLTTWQTLIVIVVLGVGVVYFWGKRLPATRWILEVRIGRFQLVPLVAHE